MHAVAGTPPVENACGSLTNPTLLAQKATAHQATLAAAGTIITYAAAVRAVAEGKTA